MESSHLNSEICPEDWLHMWYQAHPLNPPIPLSNPHPNFHTVSRHTTCDILTQSNHQCVLWHKDALEYYGVKAGLFHVHLLVHDIDTAANVLVAQGYIPYFPLPKHRTFCDLDLECWLRFPDHIKIDTSEKGSDTAVVLHRAEDWGFTLPVCDQLCNSSSAYAPASFIPHLQDLLNALIEKWLDIMIKEVLHSPAFAQLMRPEHRQYHADQISGMNLTTRYSRQHEREIRDTIRAGNYDLKVCSSSKDDERLFTGPVEARLLAECNKRREALLK